MLQHPQVSNKHLKILSLLFPQTITVYFIHLFSGQVVGKCPSEGNTLDIPTYSDKPSHSPGILSPNIPPNPPSTPVEELNNISREGGKGPTTKWNVNATPFIPANVSVITLAENNFETPVSSGINKQLDYHYVSSKLDGLAHRTDLQEQRIVSKNHKHLNSQVYPAGGQPMDRIQTIGLSTTGSSTTSESREHTSQDRSGVQARTETDDSSPIESHSGDVIPVPHTMPSNSPITHSTEDAPSIQAQSHLTMSINGRPTHSVSHSDAHIEQSVVVLSQSSISSSGGVQPSPIQNQTQSEHTIIQTDMSNRSQECKECSPHPSLHTSSCSHTVTPPLPHTVTSQSNTDLTSSRTISFSTPSRSLSPQSVASTGNAPTPSVVTPAVPKAKSWASIVGRASNLAPPAGQAGLAVSNSPSTVSGSSSSQSASCSGPSSMTCTARGGEEQSQEQKHQEINPDVSGAILKRLGGICNFAYSVVFYSLSVCFLLSEKLNQWRLSHVPLDIQPRGLINQGNWCYMHAVSFHMLLVNMMKVCCHRQAYEHFFSCLCMQFTDSYSKLFEPLL